MECRICITKTKQSRRRLQRQPTQNDHLEIVDGPIHFRFTAVRAGIVWLGEKDLQRNPPGRQRICIGIVRYRVSSRIIRRTQPLSLHPHSAIVIDRHGCQVSVVAEDDSVERFR